VEQMKNNYFLNNCFGSKRHTKKRKTRVLR